MVKYLLFACAMFSAVALQAEEVPALVVGENNPVALQDIVSVRFDAQNVMLFLSDGSMVSEPLQPLTFGTVEQSSSISAVDNSSVCGYSVYSLDGSLVRQGAFAQEAKLADLPQGTYVVRQGNHSHMVQLAASAQFGPELAPESVGTADDFAFVEEETSAAIQFNLSGIAAQTALKNIDYLSFDNDYQNVNVTLRSGASNTMAIAELASITFPELQAQVTLRYVDSEVTGVNPYYFDGVQIQTDGAGVSVTNHELLDTEVEYLLSGVSADGYFKINSDFKWKATLMGLTLTNPHGSVILSLTGKKGTVKSQNGYTNTLCDGPDYVEIPNVAQKAAIFGEGQLVFSGKGTLNVTSLAKHAIASDDYVSFENGQVNVLSALGDAVHANDSVLVQSGTITLASLSDGIDCEGSVTIRRGEKGAPALTITTTADGAKGIKTGQDFLMTDGNVTINQTGGPDKSGSDTSNVISIKAERNITIQGGKLVINNTAKGGKGLVAGGTVNISDNAVVVQ